MSSKSNTTKITLAHGAFLDGKYVPPGTERSVSNDDAAALTAAGYVVTDEQVGVVDSGAAASA